MFAWPPRAPPAPPRPLRTAKESLRLLPSPISPCGRRFGACLGRRILTHQLGPVFAYQGAIGSSAASRCRRLASARAALAAFASPAVVSLVPGAVRGPVLPNHQRNKGSDCIAVDGGDGDLPVRGSKVQLCLIHLSLPALSTLPSPCSKLIISFNAPPTHSDATSYCRTVKLTVRS